MQIYRNIDDVTRSTKTAVTIGTFDGVHLAHRSVINKVLELSKQNNSRSFIVTFEPHPQEVLKNKTPDIKLLTAIEEKLRLFEKAGVEHVLIINFTEEFSKTTAKEFYQEYIFGKIGISDLVIGYDHLFGRNREGDFGTLKKLGDEFNFSVHRVEEIDVDGEPVSSTRIRKYFAEGKIEKANELLGYEYSFDGIVIEGDKVGRTIGYPTANIQITNENKLVPGNGVYAVLINNEKLKIKNLGGMMNIGVRPTVDGTKRVIEVNIFDFDKDIYGETLTITLKKFLRSEVKFDGLDALKEQLAKDKEAALAAM